jgi:hypothetical protein
MMIRCSIACITLIVATGLMSKQGTAADPPKKALRAGVIGLDTSHAVAFTELLNSAKPAQEFAGVRVVAAFPGGSDDIPDSRNRVADFTAKVKSYGVEIVDSVEALLPKVDVVLLESVDGRPHLQQVLPVLKAKKPVFIDKPVAASLADVIAIYRQAKENNVPCFSSSALRFSSGIVAMRHDELVGDVLGCESRSPCPIEPHHPDLFWYGIHGVETLFTIMGPGCERVTRVRTDGTELVVGTWKDGRIGTFRGIRSGPQGYGAIVYGSKSVSPSGGFEGYQPLVAEIVKFFKTGKAPVSTEETLEIYAFMEAADESLRRDGMSVELKAVMDKASAAKESQGK